MKLLGVVYYCGYEEGFWCKIAVTFGDESGNRWSFTSKAEGARSLIEAKSVALIECQMHIKKMGLPYWVAYKKVKN